SMRADGITSRPPRTSRPAWSSGPHAPIGRLTSASPAIGSTGTVSAWECRTGDEVPIPGHRVVEAGAPRSSGQGHRRIPSLDGLGECLERARGQVRGARGGRGNGRGGPPPGGGDGAGTRVAPRAR